MPRKPKPNKKPFLYDEGSHYFSLSKYLGKQVKDIVGKPANPFGDTPVFEINYIVFEDGTHVWVEGEHDTVYLPSNDKLQNMSEKTLQSFIEEEGK